MKNIKDIINESSSNVMLGYYKGVIDDICYLIENAPYGRYTLNSSDIECAVKDILNNLRYANSMVNEESINGDIDTGDIIKDAKLKAFISKSIMEAIHTSVGNDYTVNSEDYS